MPNTVSLGLPLLVAEQAQKHVTHNEALRALDALVQLSVKDRDLATPPALPAEGDRYIVGASPTGVWTGHAADIAVWQDGAWDFHDPLEGWRSWVEDENAFLIFNGSAWVDWGAALGAIQNLSLLGVGTTADAANPFSAKLNKALWTAKPTAEGGDGDLRYTMNKDAAADVLSLLLQTGFSGRAEIGLIGDDDLTIKVSPDGSSFKVAFAADKATGGVRFLANQVDVASAATCDIGAAAALKVRISGTTTITSFGTTAYAFKVILFSGALTLTHNAASLILPGGANITTADGDTAIATSDGSGNWRVRAYQRASGKPVVASTYADVGVREKLTASRTYYVRTDGSNSNTGLSNTSGGAFLTIQKAWDVACALDLAGFTVTIQIADGTYSTGIVSSVQPFGGSVIIQGNNTTPANVVIAAGQFAFRFTGMQINPLVLTGMKGTLSAAGGAFLSLEAPGAIRYDKIEFGAATTASVHVQAIGRGAVLSCLGNGAGAVITISGGCYSHAYAQNGGQIMLDYAAFTLTGTPAFGGQFAWADLWSYLSANGSTTFSGSATGKRYLADNFARISTAGGGASFLPGNVAGTVGVDGRYA